jgi:hypothetical protein
MTIRVLLAALAVAALPAAQAAAAPSPKAVDLTVQIAVVEPEVRAGAPVTIRIVVSRRTAGTPIRALRLDQALPAKELEVLSYRTSAGSFAPATGWWTGFALTSQRPIVLTLSGRVPDEAARGTLIYKTAVALTKAWVDRRPQDNSASIQRPIAAKPADLAVTITDARDTVKAGSVTSYVVTVINFGPSTLTPGIKLQLGLLGALYAGTFAASRGTYDFSTKSWSGLTLAGGEIATLTVTGTIPADVRGTITASAAVSVHAAFDDPVHANDVATDTTTVVAP